jgi:hypothetical protein
VTDPYCTLAEARAAGAVGDDAAVTLAITQAEALVENYTGDFFSPRVLTVVARLGGDGRAMLPYRVTAADSITAVADADGDTSYAAGVWRTYTSSVEGDVDAVGLGRDHVGTNVLVVGLEPWAPAAAYRGRLRVTGTFGYVTPPVAVSMATAWLAAKITQSTRLDDDGNPLTPLPQTATTTDPEGNVLPVVPPFQDSDDVDLIPGATGGSTGSRKADRILAPYRRITVLVGA